MTKIIQGDCREVLKTLPDGSVDCCVTSPPYWGLRSYLPNTVRMKKDAPEWVVDKLKELSVLPIDNTSD
jgi:DNA modification methylase